MSCLNREQFVFKIDVDGFHFRLSPEHFFNCGRAGVAGRSFNRGFDCIGSGEATNAQADDKSY